VTSASRPTYRVASPAVRRRTRTTGAGGGFLCPCSRSAAYDTCTRVPCWMRAA